MWTAAATALAIVSLLLTVACQSLRFRPARWVKRHDVFCLIPTWTFFAPNPGTRDTRLFWREVRTDGEMSPWREPSPPALTPWRGLWNPALRTQKAINDAGSLIAQVRSSGDSTQMLLSVPYLVLLRYVAAQPGSPNGVARQFALVESSGDRPTGERLRVALTSYWHEIGPESRADRAADYGEVSR